jgi:putative tryptophan/tyrosine transport system substrate-binding protein
LGFQPTPGSASLCERPARYEGDRILLPAGACTLITGEVMRHRDFAALLGAAAVFLPHAGNAERRTMRRVGVLLPGAPADSGHFASAFVQGLKIAGYVGGENVTLEYRWAEGHNERLPQLAAELVESGIAVIAAGGCCAAIKLRTERQSLTVCWVTLWVQA